MRAEVGCLSTRHNSRVVKFGLAKQSVHFSSLHSFPIPLPASSAAIQDGDSSSIPPRATDHLVSSSEQCCERPVSGMFVGHIPGKSLLTYCLQDEVFHIPQAQHYCADRWDVWDPKLTTPPGLYLISYVAKPLLGCDVISLRAINAACLVALLLVLVATYSVRRKANGQSGYLSGLLACHSSLNIVLFPPLFFFSALYYTDIASTLSWTILYWYSLRTLSADRFSMVEAAVQVTLGVVSLSFRQTNIFWVAIAPAALKLMVELDQGHSVIKQSMYRRAEGFGDSTWSVAKTSWKMSVLYDPPIRDAYIEGQCCLAVLYSLG